MLAGARFRHPTIQMTSADFSKTGRPTTETSDPASDAARAYASEHPLGTRLAMRPRNAPS